jgi:hypothetical protein
MAITEKESIDRSTDGIPDNEECRYCDGAAHIKASWILTNNFTLSGYFCRQCYDSINIEIRKVKSDSID